MKYIEATVSGTVLIPCSGDEDLDSDPIQGAARMAFAESITKGNGDVELRIVTDSPTEAIGRFNADLHES
jgi:hypothetical protein